MDEFNELELQQLVDQALSSKDDHSHPFAKTGTHLGFVETDILSYLYTHLQDRMSVSQISDIFRDVRTHILSRKNTLTLKDLHTVTKNCRKCKIDSHPELPKWNVDNPDIAVVVESPSISPESVSLMVNSFKEAGFNSDQLCLTYVNRCPVKRKYSEEEVSNCTTYLHQELQLLNPKLILCLGGLPASVIFGLPVKIKEFRGAINWLGAWPILTTYSPMYAIKSGGHSLDNFIMDINQSYHFVSSQKKVSS